MTINAKTVYHLFLYMYFFGGGFLVFVKSSLESFLKKIIYLGDFFGI